MPAEESDSEWDFPLDNHRMTDFRDVAAEANQNYRYVLYHDLGLGVEKLILREIVVEEGEIEIENLFDGHVGKEDMSAGSEVGVVVVELEFVR